MKLGRGWIFNLTKKSRKEKKKRQSNNNLNAGKVMNNISFHTLMR